MSRIVPNIESLVKHLEALKESPERYQPHVCPHCGFAGLWGHGYYRRKAARRNQEGLPESTFIPIPRFICTNEQCKKTCSRLPTCLAPRRWYGWAFQQAVLVLLLMGHSLHVTSQAKNLDRHTVRRWWIGLQSRHEQFSFFLRSRFYELGRSVDFRDFWKSCFKHMTLCDAMAYLDRDKVIVP